MKKLIVLLIALFVLAGCSSTSAKVSNASDVIFKSSKTTYTQQDYFEDLKLVSFSSQIVTDMADKLAEIEGIDVDAVKETVEKEIENIKAQENGELYLTYYYGSVDSYRQLAISSEILNELMKKEVTNNIDSYIESYEPVKLQIASYDSQEKAEQLLTLIAGGKTFDTAALEAGYTTSAAASVYLNDSDAVPQEVKDYIKNNGVGLSTPILVSIVSTDSTTKATTFTYKYYVVSVVSKDYKEFEEDAVKAIANALDSTEILIKFAKANNIKFFDQATYEFMAAYNEAFK